MKLTFLFVTCLIIGSVQSSPIIKIRVAINKLIQESFKIGPVEAQYSLIFPLRDLYFEQLESIVAAIIAARPGEAEKEPWQTLQSNITRQKQISVRTLSESALRDWFIKFRNHINRYYIARIEIMTEKFLENVGRRSAILVDKCWEITPNIQLVNQIIRNTIRPIYSNVGAALRDRFLDLYNEVRRIASAAPTDGKEGDYVSEN
jgi:hypothetical protein